MSFGLGHGRTIDPAPGVVAISPDELGSLPDDVRTDPTAGYIDPRTWFAEPGKPFEIEIGSGKGTFVLDHAEQHPGINLLGIEWAYEFFAYAADRVRRRRETGSHTSVRMLNTDATEFLRWRVPDACCRVVHLYFSDPWPKTKHHKKRVVQHRFLADVWRVLEPGGELRVVTDHAELWAWDVAHFAAWVDGVPEDVLALGGGVKIPDRASAGLADDPRRFTWKPFTPPETAREGELVGTNFERKFRVEGRSFHAGVLVKPTAS
jgi:tRNA (guanine-N7-)-methyltransferase